MGRFSFVGSTYISHCVCICPTLHLTQRLHSSHSTSYIVFCIRPTLQILLCLYSSPSTYHIVLVFVPLYISHCVLHLSHATSHIVCAFVPLYISYCLYFHPTLHLTLCLYSSHSTSHIVFTFVSLYISLYVYTHPKSTAHIVFCIKCIANTGMHKLNDNISCLHHAANCRTLCIVHEGL